MRNARTYSLAGFCNVKTNGAKRPVIIYDGACAFCRRAIGVIRTKAEAEQFLYLPRQTADIEKQFPAVNFADFDKGLQLVDVDGKVHVGTDAIHFILSRLPKFRKLAWMYRMPGLKSIIRWVYSWIATNRLKLSLYCDDRCEI
jgi:predicted DCC family thiol-disulfide oxidoreductase YuxK